ncbi:beta-1,6-N-acetylglucosaminyltransferase [Pedobacter caeni]|uniref:Peptide O-xylosyltransferase n=1 Tax=Pedobacter caeni TaxID=288992 RepID=A0A1M4WSI1_9SPHI|nr:beta-1,6-N-acetylglucosaminyltransferase [Pedobacter caeni]SHE84251.1 Core-2/I-Branching enzyme [Pedobacter caeni]
MRIAHLILTYTNPKQTERMIKNMVHEDFDFYIHVDKKFDINPHLFLKSLPNVYFINNRVDVKWAGFDTVKATFESIKEIVATGIKYDFINLLSGQDYPLQSANAMAGFFSENMGKEFMSFRDYKNDWKEGLIRMERYFLSNHNFKGKNTIENALNYILPKRKLPYHMHPYGKSMFWMLSPEAAMYVVNKVEGDKKLSNFFSLCWGSDEFVFQTILMNSPLKDRIVNDNYRYIDWSGGGPNPKVLDEHDFEPIEKSGMLFARKLEMLKSAKLMNLIDTKLLILYSTITWPISLI